MCACARVSFLVCLPFAYMPLSSMCTRVTVSLHMCRCAGRCYLYVQLEIEKGPAPAGAAANAAVATAAAEDATTAAFSGVAPSVNQERVGGEG